MTKERCCIKLSNVIENNDIDEYGPEDNRIVAIYGMPNSVDDGDGYWDDMTEEYIINFCPFCGANLRKNERSQQ